MTHRYLCFGKHGASAAASGAAQAPWVLGIGVGKAPDVRDRGRVLNVIKMTTVHRDTPDFTRTDQEKESYAPWPRSVAVADVLEFIRRPHVESDLGMEAHPLEHAYDKVQALNADRLPLFAALRDWKVRLVDLPPLPGWMSMRGASPVVVTAEEGDEILRTVREYERDAGLAKHVRDANRLANGGELVCEGCGWRHANGSLFDVHHHRPVHLGTVTTTPSMLSVLCPTCHRIVHRAVTNEVFPMDILSLKGWLADHAGLT